MSLLSPPHDLFNLALATLTAMNTSVSNHLIPSHPGLGWDGLRKHGVEDWMVTIRMIILLNQNALSRPFHGVAPRFLSIHWLE